MSVAKMNINGTGINKVVVLFINIHGHLLSHSHITGGDPTESHEEAKLHKPTH